MKATTSIALALCGLSLVNSFPTSDQSEPVKAALDCVPHEGWKTIASAHCSIYGTETKKYMVDVGTDFEGTDEEREEFFKLVADTLGKVTSG